MRYKYFVTSDIQAKLDKENMGNDVKEKLKGYLEAQCPLNATALMANLLVDKYNNHSGLRFVFFKEIRKDVCLYILRRIYRHDEYSKKLTDATKQEWKERHELTQLECQEVDAVFAEFFKEAKKEMLPEEFRKYEDVRAFDKNRDVIFYEMPLWHDGMKKVPKEYWNSIQVALSEKILSNYNQYDVFMYYPTESGYTITYRFGNPNSIYKSDVYLLQIVKGKELNLDELLDRKYDCRDVTELQNFSSKCYPDYFTYEYEAWKGVEEDDMANLALSEEEVKILQTVKFPFFVSGLAGSGKSTILYYLYANIYKYIAKNCPNHKLLFLSYNDMLVEKARMSVKSILSYHSSNEGFKEYFDKNDNLQHFNQSFVPFRDFLKYSFLDEKSLELFREENHITYEKFRELYKTDYKQVGRLSPSILWSVIRTFIKGRDLTIFTPENYNSDAITRGDRTVDTKVYAKAYSIWNKWYRHYNDSNRMWDDLDLVRYVLSQESVQNVFHDYAIIFCDEAQDFTKLEIDLILKLSKHSAYKLSFHPEDKRIPIAFAGDPNQTINPTGFRWAGTKAIFNKSFEESLDSFPELDNPELSKNYRSQLGIVKFANTIQSLRYKYFDETSRDRKLQSVREDLKGDNKDALEYVGFYSYDKYKNVILNNLLNANIITSGDGEEGDLSDFPDITDNRIKLNTAIGTKGLEYNAVLLLNFCNDPSHKSFQKIISEEPFEDESERFEVAHFFTKLYIAISRAKSQLFIVDTDANYESFWKYFTDHELWEKMISILVSDEDKRKLVGHITIGDIDTLPQRLSDTYDAEENGRQAFEKAKGDKSMTLMKRAQGYFLEAGLTALADECDAYIFLYNQEYEKAGDKFITLNHTDTKSVGINAYWKGLCWAKLLANISYRNDAEGYDNIRFHIAKFMTNEVSVSEILQILRDKIDYFQNAITSHKDDQPIWKIVFDNVKEKLKSLPKMDISLILTQNLESLSRFITWYDKGMTDLLANLYYDRATFINDKLTKQSAGFRGDAYEKAVKIWEDNGDTNTSNYFRAKKLICNTISEEIIWMDKLREIDEIVNLYGDESNASSLTDEAAEIVFCSLLSKDFGKAVVYPYPKDRQLKWQRLYSENRDRFLINVVLENFSSEKYYFLEDKTKDEELSVFGHKLPTGVFDSIFSINSVDERGVPYWVKFVSSLTNRHGERVLKRSQNRMGILESISKILDSQSEYDKTLASCFLEFLFDSDYNYKRAENFNHTITTIFRRDVFFKEDFRRSTERNKYFTSYADLDNDAHDLIKNNIRKYIEQYLSNCKKVTGKNADDIKALLRACEICAAYQGTTPDYNSICNMYKRYIKETKYAEIKSWMELRLAFNRFLTDSNLMKASYSKLLNYLKEYKQNTNKLTDDLSKEDASMFVAIVNTVDEEYSYDRTLITAKLIYKHHLRRDNLKPYCRVNDLIAKLPDSIDVAIQEVLADKEHVDEYAIKVLAYTWEALFEHAFVANRYNNLIDKKRLLKLRILIDYLKKRALLHYSYLQEKLFQEKQDDYGISMTKSYLPAAYPRIEERNGDKDNVTELKDPVNIEGSTSETTSNDQKTDKTKSVGENSSVIESVKTLDNLEVARLAVMEVARNMKEQGLTPAQIHQYVNQLTIEEIEKL